ncbi:hypothetical protein [Glaciibacter psychrotolerans]|uniref:Uncharacterized protein n=1 Tax=Glaciibacter psychrotolerans TaxID=670054 RepID=A0A7Z0EFY6_9MICO|nr:hypothetical protein [Leifsonia psychrotolerans]NYJ20952.1 hypothetical protein [Leifsonia psychrotolerans]
MYAPRTKTIGFSISPDALYAAVQRTAETGKYTVVATAASTRKIGFLSGITWLSFGHEYVASITASAEGSALELVCGGRDAAPKALLDGWTNTKAADKFLSAVHVTLAPESMGGPSNE